jgi:hypothetical protein
VLGRGIQLSKDGTGSPRDNVFFEARPPLPSSNPRGSIIIGFTKCEQDHEKRFELNLDYPDLQLYFCKIADKHFALIEEHE